MRVASARASRKAVRRATGAFLGFAVAALHVPASAETSTPAGTTGLYGNAPSIDLQYVKGALNQAGKELGDDISVASFVRYQLGA